MQEPWSCFYTILSTLWLWWSDMPAGTPNKFFFISIVLNWLFMLNVNSLNEFNGELFEQYLKWNTVDWQTNRTHGNNGFAWFIIAEWFPSTFNCSGLTRLMYLAFRFKWANNFSPQDGIHFWWDLMRVMRGTMVWCVWALWRLMIHWIRLCELSMTFVWLSATLSYYHNLRL